jgi:hypothetical protein
MCHGTPVITKLDERSKLASREYTHNKSLRNKLVKWFKKRWNISGYLLTKNHAGPDLNIDKLDNRGERSGSSTTYSTASFRIVLIVGECLW